MLPWSIVLSAWRLERYLAPTLAMVGRKPSIKWCFYVNLETMILIIMVGVVVLGPALGHLLHTFKLYTYIQTVYE